MTVKEMIIANQREAFNSAPTEIYNYLAERFEDPICIKLIDTFIERSYNYLVGERPSNESHIERLRKAKTPTLNHTIVNELGHAEFPKKENEWQMFAIVHEEFKNIFSRIGNINTVAFVNDLAYKIAKEKANFQEPSELDYGETDRDAHCNRELAEEI